MKALLAFVGLITSLSLPLPVAAQDASASEKQADAQKRYATANAALGRKDYATAAPLLASLCEEGYIQTCHYAGGLLLDGSGVEHDTTRGLALLNKGCGKKQTEACNYLAELYVTGRHVERSAELASQYYEYSCSLGDTTGCWKIGERYELARGVERDWTKALDYYETACEGGLAPACTDIGTIYAGALYPKDGDPAKDHTKAAEYFRKGCDMEDGRGCAHLADKMEIGLGLEKDLEGALALYRKAAGMEIEQWVRNSVEGRIKALSSAE